MNSLIKTVSEKDKNKQQVITGNPLKTSKTSFALLCFAVTFTGGTCLSQFIRYRT